MANAIVIYTDTTRMVRELRRLHAAEEAGRVPWVQGLSFNCDAMGVGSMMGYFRKEAELHGALIVNGAKIARFHGESPGEVRAFLKRVDSFDGITGYIGTREYISKEELDRRTGRVK